MKHWGFFLCNFNTSLQGFWFSLLCFSRFCISDVPKRTVVHIVSVVFIFKQLEYTNAWSIGSSACVSSQTQVSFPPSLCKKKEEMASFHGFPLLPLVGSLWCNFHLATKHIKKSTLSLLLTDFIYNPENVNRSCWRARRLLEFCSCTLHSLYRQFCRTSGAVLDSLPSEVSRSGFTCSAGRLSTVLL